MASAAALGSVLSERRFYWAVLAVFISFMGTFTSGEQVFKAINRVGGTVVGILLGSLLAHAIGDSTWSVPVVLGALALGIYFMRASYALMVIGITITVSQLYVQLGEYSNELLVLRLEETAIGAAVAVLAAMVVFPVRTRQATRVATRDYYDLLAQLLGGIVARLEGEPEDDETPLSGLSRSLDSAGHQLRSAALPLARTPFRRDDVQHNLLLFGQASHHARNLAARLSPDAELGPAVREAATSTLRSQRRLIGALGVRLDSTISPHALGGSVGDGGPLTQELRRHGDLLGLALEDQGTLDERQFLRHLARLDETLAELGDNLSRTRPLPERAARRERSGTPARPAARRPVADPPWCRSAVTLSDLLALTGKNPLSVDRRRPRGSPRAQAPSPDAPVGEERRERRAERGIELDVGERIAPRDPPVDDRDGDTVAPGLVHEPQTRHHGERGAEHEQAGRGGEQLMATRHP